MKKDDDNIKSNKLIYKYLCLFAFIVCGYAITHGAENAYWQQTRLTVNLKNATVKEVVASIEKQSEFIFIYEGAKAYLSRKVSVNLANVTVEKILDEALKGLSVEYLIKGRQVILRQRQPSNNEEASSTPQAPAQKSVSGVVKDAMGEPLLGVNVVILGTTTGAITDINGRFSLSNVPVNGSLALSYVGYKSQTISVANRSELTVILQEDAEVLDEVIVVGFGSQKKVNLTGAVSTLSSKAFESRPVQNAGQALQGMVPGLNVSPSSNGGLGTKPNLNIRGETTIGLGSTGSPLVLIDGMEGDLNTINPQDIENISVLKDAAASSIYGSRAPFGVILVTTKAGKEGQVTVNYNNSFRFASVARMPESVDSYTFANYINEGLQNDGKSHKFMPDALTRMKQYIEGTLTTTNIVDPVNPTLWAQPKYNANANTDWYKEIYGGTAFSHEHTVSISGGSEKIKVYASMNYLDQKGLLAIGDDKYKRYATNLRVSGDIFKFLSYNYNIKFNQEDIKQPSMWSAFKGAFPNIPLKDDNGYYYEQEYRWPQALSLAEGGITKQKNSNLYQQFSLKATPIEGWNINAEINYRSSQSKKHRVEELFYNHSANGKSLVPLDYSLSQSSVQDQHAGFVYINPNVYSDYSFSLREAHHFKVMLGFQAERQWLDFLSGYGAGLIDPSLDQIDATSGLNVAGSAVTPKVGGNTNNWTTAGFFGRLNYDYKGRYLAEVNMRYDGTSRFRADKRWKWFPSVSLGWNVAQEAFWEELTNTCSLLKVRASYGELGNQNTSLLYPTYQTLKITNADSGWLWNSLKQTKTFSPALLNSQMTWETVKSINIGLDFALLQNRLSGTFDCYQRTTSDMVGPGQELPVILGKPVPNENNTEMQTNGWELSVKWQDRLKSGLGYSVGVILYDSQSKITKYPNPSKNLNLPRGSGLWGGIARNYYEGQTMGEIWGYTTLGIAKSQAEMDAFLASLPNGGMNAVGSNFGPGDIMYADLNGDKKINPGSGAVSDMGDMSIIGNMTPRYNFGLDLGADYKGFDLRVFFQGTLKRDFASRDTYFMGAQGNESVSATWEQMDYFRLNDTDCFKQNLDSYFPRPIVGSESQKNARIQTRYLVSAAYARLKNLQVGYTFPKHLTQRFCVSNLRLFISAENLFTISNLPKAYDPETATIGMVSTIYNPETSKWDDANNSSSVGASYPMQKTFSFGLSVNF